MKYEVPEINISKFSVENIVTESAASVAVNQLTAAIESGAIDGVSNTKLIKTTIDQWIQ